MATVHDIAEYILSRTGPISAMKLQKLVYYAQAWSLALTGRPLFAEAVQAWAHGPVVWELFDRHRRRFVVDRVGGDATMVPAECAEVISRVLSAYGRLSAEALSDLTHAESPWKDARTGIPEWRRASPEISQDAMARYYRQRHLPSAARAERA